MPSPLKPCSSLIIALGSHSPRAGRELVTGGRENVQGLRASRIGSAQLRVLPLLQPRSNLPNSRSSSLLDASRNQIPASKEQTVVNSQTLTMNLSSLCHSCGLSTHNHNTQCETVTDEDSSETAQSAKKLRVWHNP
jgi:hypothetical protein